MKTPSTTEIETSLTEDRTLLDKEEEEEEPTELTNPTLDEKKDTRKRWTMTSSKRTIDHQPDKPKPEEKAKTDEEPKPDEKESQKEVESQQ